MFRSSAPVLVAALALLSGLAVAAPSALANDGVYGGTGVHPMPLTTTDVRMVDEHVVLRFDSKRRAWNVTCDFTFESTARAPVTLSIGFPFPVYVEEEGDVASPGGRPAPKPGRPLVWDFETRVAGKKVAVTETRTLTNPALPEVAYPFAYLWEVTFQPGQRVKIRNTYTHGVTFVADGSTYANYVLKTGGLWRGGRIGRSKLEVHVPGVRYVMCREAQLGGEPAVTPPGGKVEVGPKGIAVRWDLPEFRPTEDLSVCLVDLDYIAGRMMGDVNDVDLAPLSDAELRILRNRPYALHGYVFKARDLREHYGQQWWYRPDPAFTPKALNVHEHAFVARVLAEEKRREAARPRSR